ncbi:glutathione transferase GstA [Polaromonas sp. A23]|jgi:glutathione S-transferase|uniref:glutathione transferase GstA n=1 Tax=Polaromonas sp. A23 TaxID=1944133 RepID=UPI0009868DD1|nr:glutathione transferase GstA [Polaromonas sp. A23]OOG39891.1 glutathione transferase GstA [Polaromonas sp. A23]
MKLFFSPGACSLAPHIVLKETQQAFKLEKVDTATHTTAGGADYYAINPKGAVPVLELENGERLTEGPIIAQYIADKAARADLLPAAGSMERYRVMEWQNYITSELHKTFTPLFNPDLDSSAKKTLASVLRKKYEWVNTQLQSKDYLLGQSFTVADAYLFAVTGWAKYVSLDLADLKHLQDFLARVAGRPAVREALKAEGLLA